MTEQIIKPSPAQNIKSKDENIKSLLEKLRVIDNFSNSLKNVTKFQDGLDNESKKILLIGEAVCLINMIFVGIKSSIDMDYMNIKDHPQNLKQSMEATYTNIDDMRDSLMKSLKDLLTTETVKVQSENLNVLNEMIKSSSKLPSI